MFDIIHLYPSQPRTTRKKLVFKDGIYEGDVLDKKPHGKGVFTKRNLAKHDGEWKDGLPHGYGKATYEGGEYYEGYFYEGKRQGQGKYLS